MTNSIPPKVSVCIPVYNGSEYIAESIESVLAQTYKDFHLTVCDNCSTDNTEEIVRGFSDSRLTYVRNAKNLGLVGNTNRCLELANGKYVNIWHHDDVMLPDNLERKVRLLDEHPEVGFVHSNIIIIDSHGEVLAQDMWNEDARRDYIEDGLMAFKKYVSCLPLGASYFVGAVLARRSCYKQIGEFSPELPHCNDSEMWMRMLLFYDVACIGSPLVKYRVHTNTASSKWGNYISMPYIKEHYQAVTMIFNKYNDKIPHAKTLKRQIFLSFGERVLKSLGNELANGNSVNGIKFFKEAVNMSPWVVKSGVFWRTVFKMIVGPKGIKFYKALNKS